MFNIKMICATILGLLFATVASAQNVKSSNVTLGGGEVLPRLQFNLPLNKLVPGFSYTVRCKAINSSNSSVVFSVSATPVLVNGTRYWSSQNTMAAGTNTLEMPGYYDPSKPGTFNITFANADQDTKFTIDSCYAVAN